MRLKAWLNRPHRFLEDGILFFLGDFLPPGIHLGEIAAECRESGVALLLRNSFRQHLIDGQDLQVYGFRLRYTAAKQRFDHAALVGGKAFDGMDHIELTFILVEKPGAK